MSVQCLEWNYEQGKELPTPLLSDDSASFPPEIVRQVRAALDQRDLLEKERQSAPTPQIIRLAPLHSSVPTMVEYLNAPTLSELHVEFQIGQYQILLRDKRAKTIVAEYQYVCARTRDGRIILGPELHRKPR